jgi:hypothetical protein
MDIREKGGTPVVRADPSIGDSWQSDGNTIRVGSREQIDAIRAVLRWVRNAPTDDQERQCADALSSARNYCANGEIERHTGTLPAVDCEGSTARLRDCDGKSRSFRFNPAEHRKPVAELVDKPVTCDLAVFEDASPFGESAARRYELRAISARVEPSAQRSTLI